MNYVIRNRCLIAAAAAGLVSACSSSDISFSVSGEVSGLDTGALVLSLNGEESLTVEEDGSFQFDSGLEHGATYTVELLETPEVRRCQIENDSGQIDMTSVDNVTIECAPWGLSAFNEREAVEVVWEPADGVDLYYSSDPECGWENVQQCAQGGVITQGSGEAELSVANDNLELDQTLYFVAAYDGQISHSISATPSRYLVRGDVHDVVMQADQLIVGGEPANYGVRRYGLAQFAEHGGEYRHAGAVLNFERDSTAIPSVNSVFPAPDGGWYISGMFDRVDGFSQSNLIRVKANGQVDEDWLVDVTGVWVSIEEVDEDRIYLTGRFTITEDGEEYPVLVALNHDGSVDTSFQPEVPFNAGGLRRPEPLVVHEDRIFISGFFSKDADENEENIAALDRQTGALIEEFTAEMDSRAVDLMMHDGHLYVGGQFTEVNGESHSGLVKLNPSDGSLDPDFQVDIAGSVFTLESHGDSIFVGGSFAEIDGVEAPNLAVLDATTGARDSNWDIHADDFVVGIDYIDDSLYIAGGFTLLGDRYSPSVGRVDVSGSGPEVDGQWMLPIKGTANRVIQTDDGYLVYGGLSGAGGQNLGGLYALSLEDGQPVEDWEPDVQGAVYAVLDTGTAIYAGGEFEYIADESQAYAAAFDPADAGLLSWNPAPDGRVLALEYSQSGVYLGGGFEQVQEQGRERVALVDAVTGAPMTTAPLDIDGDVNALYFFETEGLLFIGGEFDSVNGSRPHVAVLDSQDLDPLGWSPEPNDTVHALNKVDGNRIMLGGEFTTISGTSQHRFATVNESAQIQGSPPNVNGTVRALSYEDNDQLVLLGGDFDGVGGSNSLGGFAALTFDEVNDEYSLESNLPVFDDDVWALDQSESAIVVGGEFDHTNDSASGPVVLMDRETFEVIWPQLP